MPADLNTSIEFLKGRVDKTLSVQDQIKTTWLWRHKTIAQWEAVSSDLDKTVPGSLAQVAIAAQTSFNAATGALDARLARIHQITVPIVESMRTEADRNSELKPVVNDLSGRGGPRGVIEDEGTALLSAWDLEFGGSAFAPGVGDDITYDAFNALFIGRAADPGPPAVTALPSLRTLKRAQSDAATVHRRESGRVGKRLALIEKDCQDWYAEATRYFPEGTEIGDLIRAEVPTTSDYNPPTPTPPPPTPPTPPTP